MSYDLDAKLRAAKKAFLDEWSPKGVACGLGRNAAGERTLEARIHGSGVSERDVPTEFGGYPVHTVVVGETFSLGQESSPADAFTVNPHSASES